MQYGICPLSIVPLRAEPKNASEQTSQLLYGEFFIILNQQKSWSKIQNSSDGYEGWINNKHFKFIEKSIFQKLQTTTKRYSTELVDFIWKDDNILFPTPIGSLVSSAQILGHRFEGKKIIDTKQKNKLVSTCLLYTSPSPRD